MIGLGLELGRGTRGRAPELPPSLPLVLHGPGATLDGPDADGRYRLRATGGGCVVGSAAALSGDFLLEVFPDAAPPNVMWGVSSTAPGVGASFTDPGMREIVQTEGGGGGPEWLGAWRGGQFTGALSARNGGFWSERRGGRWRVHTGPSWKAARARGPIWDVDEIDGDPRFLAVTGVAAGVDVGLRWIAHPGD